jgi:hypothetical protein
MRYIGVHECSDQKRDLSKGPGISINNINISLVHDRVGGCGLDPLLYMLQWQAHMNTVGNIPVC